MIPKIPKTFKCFLKGGFFDGESVFIEAIHNVITKYKPVISNEGFNLTVVPVTDRKYIRIPYRRIGETQNFEYFK